MPERSPRRSSLVFPLVLVGLVAVFLAPYVFLGQSMVPLDLVPILQPWAAHARELWNSPPQVQNPLLDSLQQYYPRRVYMQQALHGGWLPLWNPYAYGGTPFLGAQQGAVLYPPAWVLSLLPAELQFGWSAFFHLSLAAVGGYLFFRQLSLRAGAAAVGGAAFAFNGFVVVWLAYPNVSQWTLCWLPLALYCWERGRSREHELRWYAASGGVLALALLGGHGQSSLYTLLAWGIWTLLRAVTSANRLRTLVRGIALPAGLAVLLALGHLLPVLDYVPRTDRAGRVSWDAVHQAAMPPSQLWTVLLPRLFGDNTAKVAQEFWLPVASDQQRLTFIERSFYPGVSVLVLGAAALVFLRRRRRNTADDAPPELRHLAWFGVGVTVTAFLLAMGTYLYWPFWQFAPGFGQFTAVARVISIAGWSLACLAALGVHALTGEEDALRGKAATFTAAAGGILGGVVLLGHFIYGGAAPDPVRQYLTATNQPSPDALALRDLMMALAWAGTPAALALLSISRSPGRPAPMQPRLLGALALFVVAADLFAFGFGYNPATDPALIRATTPELDYLKSQAAASQFRFLSAGQVGTETLFNQRLPSNLPGLFGLLDIDGSDSFVPLRYREWETATRTAGDGPHHWSRFASPNLRSAAVRYYLTTRKEAQSGLQSVAGPLVQGDAGALPFARLHTNAKAMTTKEDLLAALASRDRLASIAMTFGPHAPSFNGPPTVVPFTATRSNGNRMVVEGQSPQRGLLVVAEQFDPAWRARVDGKPTQITTADHLFMGVPLEAGSHKVEFTYAPQPFRAGLFGSLVGIALLLGLVIPKARRTRDAH